MSPARILRVAVIVTLIILVSCNKDAKQSAEPRFSYPLTLAMQPVPGTFYLSYNWTEYSHRYWDTYRALRDTVWRSFVANPGDDINYGYVGQMAFASVTTNMDEDEWSWRIDYHGYTDEYKYTLASKSGYTSASLFLYLGRGDGYYPEEEREFVPCYLYITTYNHSPLFEFYLDESYDFWEPGDTELKEIKLSQWQFNALPIGTDVPLYVEISTFKEINPLPEDPPPWPHENFRFTRCSMCAINFYITLYP